MVTVNTYTSIGVLFVYILESSSYLAVFYLFYRLLLSCKTFHRFNRTALLRILLLSYLLPFVEVSVRRPVEVYQTIMTWEQWLLLTDLAGTEAHAMQVQGNAVTWIQGSLLIYLFGILFFMLHSICSLFGLWVLLRSGRREKASDYAVAAVKAVLMVHKRDISPFSWTRYIVISQKNLHENSREILTHELVHIRNRHSWDLFAADTCMFFQWFNPAAWLLKQELQNIHEYEASGTVINEGVDARQYQLLLIRKVVGTRPYSIANNFDHSKLKKRITMVLKEKSGPWACLKYLYALPVATIAIAALTYLEVSEAVEEIFIVKVSDLTTIVETKVAESSGQLLPVQLVPKDSVNRRSKVAVQWMGELVIVGYASEDSVRDREPVFSVVEQMPSSPEGTEALVQYLAKSMRYPVKAQKNKVQGRVVVGFIVSRDGDIKKTRILRGVDPELDAEAIRVVGSMPGWTPDI